MCLSAGIQSHVELETNTLVSSVETTSDGPYLNPRCRKCLLPSLVIAFLAVSSRFLEPSSFTATERILPSGTAFKYWTRRSLSFLDL